MKTKKKTYVLLALVVSVWGTITYKVIAGLNPDVPELSQQHVVAIKDFKVDTKLDTFSIATVNRDPFLGTVLKKQKGATTKKKKKIISWKPIEYLGIVKNDNKNQNVFIVKINGKQCLLKKGQIRDSIVVVGGNRKRVTLRYKNNTKTFPIKQQS